MSMQQLIQACRENLKRRSGWLNRMLGAGGVFRAIGRKDDVPDSLRPHYHVLLRHGTAVWGHVVQANMAIYSVGATDLPSNTIYGLGAYFDDHPNHLSKMAHSIFALKGTTPSDRLLRVVAATITDEHNMILRQHVPTTLTAGHELFMATTILHRDRLPGRRLQSALLPLVVAPEHTQANMILPRGYWPEDLFRRWESGEKLALSGPKLESVSATSELLARDRELVGQFREPQKLDAKGQVFAITPACAEVLKRMSREQRMPKSWCIKVGLQKGGLYSMDMSPTVDAAMFRTESQGISILLPKDALDRFRGTVLDWRVSAIDSGFVFENPND